MFIKSKKSDSQLQMELTMQLGSGPMRFGPVQQECSVQAEAVSRGLSDEDILGFAKIKATWETDFKTECKRKAFTDSHIMRIAIYCEFNERRAISLMRRSKGRLFELSAIDMEDQLRSKTLFPCPGLKTSDGSNVFYMRPSRYFPKETTVSDVIDNLIFVMDKMVAKDSKQGIAFLANMEGWNMYNFSTEYCRKFMNVLQGRIFPAKVDLFIILNPPSWFGKVWAIMKPMLSENFRKKVHIIQEDELPYFMELDFEKYLPDEVWGGQVDTDALVKDFVRFHQHLERATNPLRKKRSLFGGLPKLGIDVSKKVKDLNETKRRGWFKNSRRNSLGGASEHSTTSVSDSNHWPVVEQQ